MVKALRNNQRLVNYFVESLNIKIGSSSYKAQLGIANTLLKDYSLDDLCLVIDYLKKYPTKTRVYSLGYMKFIIDDILPKAKVMKLKEEREKLIEFTNEKLEVNNKRKESNSLFKRGKF